MLLHSLSTALLLLICGGALPLLSQTRIDLRSQSRNVDFSGAQSVRPFKTGDALPAACLPGEMFFKTSGQPGANVWGCVATNIWALQGNGSATASAAGSEFRAELDTSTNTLSVTCTTGSCNVQIGDTVRTYPALQASFTPSAGNYTAYVYLDSQGLRYGYPSGAAMSLCTATCVSGINAFPPNVVPLYSLSVYAGAFQAGSLRDCRTQFRAPKKVLQGPNIVISETADSIVWSTPATLRNQPPGPKPACSQAARGLFWHQNGTAGVKDTVEVCAKDAADNFQWRTIY